MRIFQNDKASDVLCGDGCRNGHVDIATANHTFTNAHLDCTAESAQASLQDFEDQDMSSRKTYTAMCGFKQEQL